MAQTTITGAAWLEDKTANALPNFPLSSYLNFGTLTNESWSSATYDPEAASISLSFKSEQGSSIKWAESQSGTDTQGSYKASSAITGKPNGTKISFSGSTTWSANSSSDTKNLTWSFTGGTTSKEDDFTYKLIQSSNDKWSNTSSGSKGSWTAQQSIDYSDAAFTLKQSYNGAGQWTYDNESGENTVDKKSTTTSYLIKDLVNGISLSYSGTIKKDLVADTAQVDLSGIKFFTPDYSVMTAKFSAALTNMEISSLPNTDAAEINDLSKISENNVLLASFFFAADNTISISSSAGVAIDAGEGNDKVTGGIGNDTITAGAGKDTLTGGKGNDTFVLKKEDYDFTSAKTVLADTISDFKYLANGEQDALRLDGFGDVEVYKTLALAKNAKSTAEVIYESGTGKFWYNTDDSGALAGVMAFATAKGLSNDYLIQAGWLAL